jgi:hypothetical protein
MYQIPIHLYRGWRGGNRQTGRDQSVGWKAGAFYCNIPFIHPYPVFQTHNIAPRPFYLSQQ